VPIACSLERSDQAARAARWDRLRRRAQTGRIVTPDGLRLVFRGDPAVEAELRELAELERGCCGFADWSVGRGRGLVLDVRAHGDAVAAVQAMFTGGPAGTASAAPSPR
jgi:hypothetical protein